MMTNTALTPPQIALRYRVAPETVIGWIRSGELRAFNAARPDAKRPRYRVMPDALVEFENRRSAATDPKPERSKRRRNEAQVIPFF